MIREAQHGWNGRFLALLALAAFLCTAVARAQVLTPSSMTLIGVGATGKATFISLPDCPVDLRVTVYLIEPPAIGQKPASQSVAVGTDVTCSVAATGNQLRYQWRLNGVNIPCAVSDTPSIPNVQAANDGDYNVIVFNPAGVVVSA